MTTVQPGKYQHFKGSIYEVIGVAIHSETKEQMVVYKEEFTNTLLVRPLKIFTEHVVVDGKEVPRFRIMEKVL